jgi:transposase
MLIKSDGRLHRSYLLKEGLRNIFKYSYAEAVIELDKWLSWASRCRIAEFVKLGKKIKRHKLAILSSIKHDLTNARVEDRGNKIKVTIRMGYGFRNIDNLISLVRLKCGGFDIRLPGRKKKKSKN